MAVHYAAHIGIAPSSCDWILSKTQKYHYHGYASSPCTTAVYFVRFLSLHAFASMPCLAFPHVHSKPFWNRHIVAHPHRGYTYPHVLYAMQYSVVKISSPYGETSGRVDIPLTGNAPLQNRTCDFSASGSSQCL